MKTWWNWREDKERQRGSSSNRRTEEIHDAGKGKGSSLSEAALSAFEAQDLNTERYTKAAVAVQNAIQCYHVIYDEKKRATTQASLDPFFKKVDNSTCSQQGTRTCAVSVRCEWNCSLPSVACCWRSFSSAISHFLSFLQSVTLFTCSPDASSCWPALILFYCTFWASLVSQTVKNLPVMQETQIRSLGREDPLEKGIATHSSILVWRIP